MIEPTNAGGPSSTGGLLRQGADRLRATGSESPRLDAELLLAHAVGVDRTTVVAHHDAPVGTEAGIRYLAFVERRATGEPVAYIRGMKEFFGIALAVDARALIPRPETEALVETAQAEVMGRLTATGRSSTSPRIRVADVGTGSGAVAVALIVALRRGRADGQVTVVATDQSVDALELARENAAGHGVADHVRFVEADLLPAAAGSFDLVLANLPYVRTAAIDNLPIAASFEPRSALDGGPDGLSVIDRLLARLPEALVDGGVALLEIGADQGDAIVTHAAASLPGWSCIVRPDLAGLPRIARITRLDPG